MNSTRQQKVGRLLQKELGSYFQKNSSLYCKGIITVTTVRVSPDLAIAKVYLSFFPNDTDNTGIDSVTENTPAIRHSLAQLIRNQVRIIPALTFFEDDSLDYADNIDKLLKQ